MVFNPCKPLTTCNRVFITFLLLKKSWKLAELLHFTWIWKKQGMWHCSFSKLPTQGSLFRKNQQNTSFRYGLLWRSLVEGLFFRNHLVSVLNDELYSKTKVFAKKFFLIFKNSYTGGQKNDDFCSGTTACSKRKIRPPLPFFNFFFKSKKNDSNCH